MSNTKLIARLRDNHHTWRDTIDRCSEAADALEAAQAEIERLKPITQNALEQWRRVQEQRDAALERIESINDDRNYVQGQLREALARLAELEKQKPVGFVHAGELQIAWEKAWQAAQSAQPLREEAVEAGASALVDSCVAKGHWSHTSEESKSIYRKHARAVLTAARSAQ